VIASPGHAGAQEYMSLVDIVLSKLEG